MIEQLDILINSPYCLIALASIIGLMVGSFLNVVIYRLPIMMQSNWEKECCEFLNINLFDITKKENQLIWLYPYLTALIVKLRLNLIKIYRYLVIFY